MPDRIVLTGLEFRGRHGVFPEERKLGQTFVVDLELALNLEEAGRSDELARTVDYAAVYEKVRAIVEGEPRQLIEAVAESIARAVLGPPVSSIVVRVHKPSAPLPGPFRDVYVEIERHARDSALVYLSIGSNQGDRKALIDAAIDQVNGLPGTRVVRRSGYYETEPVGPVEQDWFLNAAVAVETSLGPHELLDALQDIERRLGRVRTVRWGPRTIDLDIGLFGRETIRSERLTVPHPRLAERAFVLVPFLELDPELTLPTGERLEDLLADLGEAQEVREWHPQ